MIYLDNKFIHLTIFDSPLKTWWKARKYFKFPKFSIDFGLTYHLHRIDKETYDKFKCNFKYFKFMDKYYYIYHYYNSHYANPMDIGRILDISSSDVSWKDKYGTPRHEFNPKFYICLFNIIEFSIIFGMKYEYPECDKQDVSMEYWEYMLDYLHYSKSLKYTSCWEYESKVYKSYDYKNDKSIPVKMVIPTPLFSLNKKGKKEFIKLYREDGNN